MAENNAYAILGLTKGVSDKDLKTAYVNLVKKYDPEKHTERFMVIQNAYDRLKSVKSRAKEDLFTYNMAQGEFLFQQDEKSAEVPPDEAEVSTARGEYRSNPMDETARNLILLLLAKRAHYATQRKQLSDAIRDWTEVLEIDPSQSRARHNLEVACSSLGVSYGLHGLHEEAIELWEKALSLNPDNSDIVHNLALIAEKVSDPERAGRYWAETVARWKSKLSLDPDNEYLRQLITEALTHNGAIISAPRRAVSVAPHAPAPPLRMGAAHPPAAPPPPTTAPPQHRPPVSSSNIPGPRSSPSNQVPADLRSPSAPPAAPPSAAPPASAPPAGATPSYSAQAPAEAIAGLGSALERSREISRLNPNDFDAAYQLCNRLMEEKLWAEAQTELQNLSRKHPKNTEVLNLMGWAMLNNNQIDNAFLSWKKSMQIDPKNPSTREQQVRAHLLLGKSFRNKGMFTKALVHFKQLLTLMPGSAEVHLEIAATYDMKGEVQSAAAEYHRVLEIDPKNKVAKKAVTDLKMKR